MKLSDINDRCGIVLRFYSDLLMSNPILPRALIIYISELKTEPLLLKKMKTKNSRNCWCIEIYPANFSVPEKITHVEEFFPTITWLLLW